MVFSMKKITIIKVFKSFCTCSFQLSFDTKNLKKAGFHNKLHYHHSPSFFIVETTIIYPGLVDIVIVVTVGWYGNLWLLGDWLATDLVDDFEVIHDFIFFQEIIELR